jgi:Na+-driven multidrug efflux pump
MYTSVLFAIFASAMMFVSVLSSIANGLGNLKTQFWCYSIGATIKIPLSILFINACNEWHGVMIANIICMLLYCLVEPFVLNRYFKNQHN